MKTIYNFKKNNMKNIWLLPTDKPSKLRYNLSNILVLTKEAYRDYRKQVNQNIYITSDEKPRQEEWCLDLDTNTVFKIGNWKTNRAKKIIITDNEALISDGVQKIDDEFLEWFVKNPSCERVEVINEQYTQNYHKDIWYNRYKIIIPKEEAEQDNVQQFQECIKSLDNNFKEQETLEEVAERLSNTTDEFNMFIAGAKWQQEQNKNLYSEEDLEKAYKDGGRNEYDFINKYHCKARISFDKWFEQFKKK